MPCKRCGAAVSVIPTLANLVQEHGAYCEPCLEAVTAQKDRDRRKVATVDSFARICPPCFADTDAAMLPCPAKTAAALKWEYGKKGLNLWGEPGTGKTRTMSLVLERQIRAGRKVVAMGPGAFREQCERLNYSRSGWLRRLRQADILFIDDFDKMNLTRGMEKDLFGVLTERMGRRPVMVTGNTHGDRLEKQFSLGKPMVDRFRRYCVCIHFGEEDVGK